MFREIEIPIQKELAIKLVNKFADKEYDDNYLWLLGRGWDNIADNFDMSLWIFTWPTVDDSEEVYYEISLKNEFESAVIRLKITNLAQILYERDRTNREGSV